MLPSFLTILIEFSKSTFSSFIVLLLLVFGVVSVAVSIFLPSIFVEISSIDITICLLFIVYEVLTFLLSLTTILRTFGLYWPKAILSIPSILNFVGKASLK